MSLKLHIVSVQPSDRCFADQIRIQLHALRKINYSQYYRILIFVPYDRLNQDLSLWKKLEADYPESNFFYFFDRENFTHIYSSIGYIPLIRPYCLAKHWENYPELKNSRILYLDSDCLILKPLPFEEMQDNVNYLSDTKSYNGASYFMSKRNDVKPLKLESYDNANILEGICSQIGITKETIIENENNTGGAQYCLINIDEDFWNDVLLGCMNLYTHLGNINITYFPNENKGIQKWASDMWSVLWNLWKRKMITETPSFMDFCWSTDNISKWDKSYIYHDAGATENTPYLYNKRKTSYLTGQGSPFEDDLSFVSPEYCSFKYVQAILDAKPN